jgi:DNA-binding NarL/FixJ family response regulator
VSSPGEPNSARSDPRRRSAAELAVTQTALVVESDLVRRRVCAALNRGRVRKVRRFASVAELEAARGEPPEVAIVCFERLGPEQAAVVVGRLCKRWPDLGVVLVAPSLSRRALGTALANGLAGFVKEADVDSCLLLALEAACCGQVLLPRAFGKMAAQPALSVREKQILALVVMGLSNAEIAQTLFVTESTVKSHLSSAFTRLGVRSRNQATALILDPESGFGSGILAISGDERRRGG